MTFSKPFVATLAILATIGVATGPASARKHHHKMTSETQSQMTTKNKTTTGQSVGQTKSSGGATNKESAGMGSSGSGPSGGPSGQASPKQTK